MRNRVRALLCLLVFQMAACTAVPSAAPVLGRSAAASPPTAASMAVPATGQQAAPTATPPYDAPTPTLPIAPVLPTEAPTRTLLAATATPVYAAASYRQPWQYFSGAFLFDGPLVYRLRYPIGWHALRGEGGAAVLQNFPPAEDSTIAHGRIRVELNADFSTERGGFPAPNQRPLAAGHPGTRQVLVDSDRGVTIYNARLYGLSESSAVFHLTGYLSGSTDPAEGVRLLDAMLETLELYAAPDPFPAPVVSGYSPAESWQQYAGRLDAGPETVELRLRFPPGWWAYPEGARRLEVTNWVVTESGAGTDDLAPGAVRLSINAEPCAEIGGCPARPGWLNNDMPGTREITQRDGGDTLWLVRAYHGQARFTLSAILSGSEEQVQDGILALNMMLRTFSIVP